MQQTQRPLYRNLVATGLHAMGDRLRMLARRLDDSVGNLSTANARQLRQELNRAARIGQKIRQADLDAALFAFPVPQTESAINWEHVSRLERWRTVRALHRAAQHAHPMVAFPAMKELCNFTPQDLRTIFGSARAEPEKIASYGADAIPYLVNWYYTNHVPGIHPAANAIALIRDPNALDYLQRLSEFANVTGDGKHLALSAAAREAYFETANIVRSLVDAELFARTSSPGGF